jgi:glycosyltransferase involved in cell wall biosynthesis
MVTIVLPCYNEEGHVLAELERITAAMDASPYSYDLDVYDDCSSDGTRDILAAAAKVRPFPRMRYLPRHRNGGSGTIRRIGSENARGEIVAWTDADMTYPNERIPEFVKMLDEDPSYDQIVGARRTEEGTYKFLRVPAKWVIRKIARGSPTRTSPTSTPGCGSSARTCRKPYLRLLPPASPA